MDQSVSSLFLVRPAFLRSVDVAEDYTDPRSSAHYIVTNLVRETLGRISSGLRPSSSQRAWRLTGDYGTGKSSFALALARVAAGQHERLPHDLQHWMDEQVKFEPILVTGELEPVRRSILRGIRETEYRAFGNTDFVSSTPSNDELLDLLDRLNERIRASKTGDGLLLILDEIGQNLRYAAQHPDDDDIFLLQRLADKAVRSNGSPLMVVALLHQGFASYSAAADSVAKREWDKVASRYEEIVFAQPIEQTAVLLAETLGVREHLLPQRVHDSMRTIMSHAVKIGLYGSLAAEQSLLSLAPRLFPLNPVALPVLIALFRKFGQNERSIVSFVTSFEPFGLRAFAERVSVGQRLYRISDLYDYFKANLSQLSFGPSRARWDIAEAVVDKVSKYGKIAENLLKAAALINMIDDPSLPSTREVLLASEPESDAADVIERLVSDERLLHERGTVKGLWLWPHTSADLEDLLRQADAALGGANPSTMALLDYLPEKQLVARRHYVESGNLRHFFVRYGHAKNTEELLKQAEKQSSSDGTVIVIVPFSKEEHRTAVRSIRNTTLPKQIVCGVSAPVAGVSHLLGDLKRWEWVQKNAHELFFDRLARDYVREEIERLRDSLRRDLDFLTDFVVDHSRPIRWFHDGRKIRVEKYRGIAGYLSILCEELYPDCPIVRNELINRRFISSAASRARTILIEALATRSTEKCLGLDGDRNPPELAIYLSVLREGRIHVPDGDSWRLVLHSEMDEDPCRLVPSLKRIHDLLIEADLDPVPVNHIYEELRWPPLGVRDGLIPLIVAVYLSTHWQETSVYEDGTFLLNVGGDEFQKINKEPEAFAFQHCSVSGIRLEVYHQLCKTLGTETSQDPDVLTVVRPLISFAVSLPEYARHVHTVLSLRSRKVRDILLSAREPATLLFRELPEALGLPVVKAETFSDHQISNFATQIKESIAELRNAYPALLVRIRLGLQGALGMGENGEEFRSVIARRSSSIVGFLTDLSIKAFVLRLGDLSLLDRQWIESIATFLAKKAPERWRDKDEEIFFEQLATFAPRFRRLESIGFNTMSVNDEELNRRVRLTVTRPDGSEADEVLYWNPEDDHRLQSAEEALNELIRDHGKIVLAAAARLFWQRQVANEDDSNSG